MNLLTKQNFVSRDVQFYEHIFPYQKGSYDKYMQPIPEVKTKAKDMQYNGHLDGILFQMSNQSDPAFSMGDNAVSYSSEVSTPLGEPTSTTEIAVEQRHAAQPVRRSVQVRKTPTWTIDFVTQK